MRIDYTPLRVVRDATDLQAIFDAIAAGSAEVESDNFVPESFDRRVLPSRPTWERFDDLPISGRDPAILPTASWTDLTHQSTNVGFTFAGPVGFSVLAGERIRFGCWLSFESTPASLGFEGGDMGLRWSYAGAAMTPPFYTLPVGIARGSAPTEDYHYNVQAYLEAWVIGPTTFLDPVRVQYTMATAGSAGHLTRSYTFMDRYFRLTD